MGAHSAEMIALRQRAERHAAQREWEQAEACFEALRSLAPGDVDVLLQLSYIASLSGRYRDARAYALDAEKADPRKPELVQELLARLRTFNEIPALNHRIARLGRPASLPIPLLIFCASQLSNLNEQERALRLLDEARRGDPNYPPTLLARGQVLTYLGRFDEVRAELLASLRRAPEIARTYWLLAGLARQTAASNHVEQIRRELQRPGRAAEDVALLAFALHKSLDDLGDHASAWKALEAGCAAKRSSLQYRSTDSVDLFDLLRAFPASLPTAPRSVPAGSSTHTPVFVVGMHRSGTTLLEQLLHGHSDVRGLGELYDFTTQMRYATDHHCRGVIDRIVVERAHRVDFAEVGRRYLEGVQWRLGDERLFIDKLPSNFLNIGFICSALPGAKILHMVRDPMETCFSNLRELFSDANPYSYDQLELADFHGQYRRLMAHWHRAFPGRILDVSYARLTAAPESTLREVTAFCGIPFEPGMLDLQRNRRSVATASAVQVRGGIESRQVPKWLSYAEQLGPLADRLGLDSN